MCLSCWDADERKTLLATDDCDGHLTPFMTVNDLKAKIIQKWQKTKQTSHVVYREAIIAAPEKGVEWIETLNSSPVTLKVKFISF